MGVIDDALIAYLDVCALLRMPLQIPAGHVPSAGKHRMDAGLRLRRIKDELSLAVFLQHCIVARDRDLAEGLAVRRDSVAENKVVRGVRKYGEAESRQKGGGRASKQQMTNFPTLRRTHRGQLYWLARLKTPSPRLVRLVLDDIARSSVKSGAYNRRLRNEKGEIRGCAFC